MTDLKWFCIMIAVLFVALGAVSVSDNWLAAQQPECPPQEVTK